MDFMSVGSKYPVVPSIPFSLLCLPSCLLGRSLSASCRISMEVRSWGRELRGSCSIDSVAQQWVSPADTTHPQLRGVVCPFLETMSSCVSELSLPPPGTLSSPHPSIFQSAPNLCWPLLSPHTGGGHHGDAGAEAASLPVASLGHLWARVRAGGPLVPAVSDPCGARRPSAQTTSCSQGPRVGCPLPGPLAQ